MTLSEQIRALPTRTEWLGGQRTSYVQLDSVLGLIDARQAPAPRTALECAQLDHTVGCRCAHPRQAPADPPGDLQEAIFGLERLSTYLGARPYSDGLDYVPTIRLALSLLRTRVAAPTEKE